MMEGDHGQTNQLHHINWSILNHAFRTIQLANAMLTKSDLRCYRQCSH